MDLREFISESLSSILNGIEDAHEKIEKKMFYPAIYHIGQHSNDNFDLTEKIDFQIVVTIEKGGASSVGAKISVFSLGAGGETATDSRQKNQNVIRFSVPVFFSKQPPPVT